MINKTPVIIKIVKSGIIAVDSSMEFHYYWNMIASWKDKEARKIWEGEYSKKFPVEIQRNARKKLIHIHAAVGLSDLKVSPGNRLHALTGKRKGQYSIDINDQWRICFKWDNGNAFEVEITDYH